MSFDISTNAATLAALTQRCLTMFPNYAPSFTLASAPTTRLTGNHPQQRAFMPVTANRTAVAWSAQYRGRNLPGRLLVVDTNMLELGKAAVLDDAQKTLDSIDLKMLGSGSGSGAFGVLPGQ